VPLRAPARNFHRLRILIKMPPMSVNVDFKISVSGFGANKQAVVQQVSDLLAGEGLLDQLDTKDGKHEVVFQSGDPIIISKSYEYLPQLQKQLGGLAKGGVAIDFKTRTEGGGWEVASLGTTSTKKARATVAPMARQSTKLSVTGKTVVLTGTVTGMQRKDAEAKLEGMGARVTGSVSKQTDYVFAMADAGSKKAQAERLGIVILGETELFALIGKPGSKPKASAKPITKEAKAKVAARAPKPSAGFAGTTVVITGTLSQERDAISKILTAAGAKVAGAVSANTQYLITGAGVGAAKISKATALGVTVIDEAAMNKLLAKK